MKNIRYGLALMAAVLMLSGCGKGDELNKEGLRLYGEGKFTEAVTQFEAAIVEDNKEPAYYNNMGMAYLELKMYDAAESAFQMALSLEEEDKTAYRGLGILQLREGNYKEAVTSFAKAIELAGNKIGEAEYDCMLYKAEAELGMEDYTAAISTYGALVGADGKNVDYRYLRGRAYLMQGSLEDALGEFDAGIAHAPKDYDYYMNIYALLNARGYAEEGKDYLKSALTIGGDSDEVHLYRGEIQYLLGNCSSAIAEYNAVKGKMSSRHLLYLGLSYTQMGDTANAYDTYMRAVEQEADNAAIYEELGRMKMEEGDYRMAINFFEQGIALNDPDLLWNMKYSEAICYEYLHDYGTALQKFEALNAQFGERPEVTHEIEFLKTR
ncbi:MAG: tetratricopeptide repeat protein [Lachnospiraceae bacterium]|nr:tetratricopeptide repeat protein [Lachnospiraceae bacterium]